MPLDEPLRRISPSDLILVPAPDPSRPPLTTMPCSTRSARPTPICGCDGSGTLIEQAGVAEAEQLIIVSRYPIGDRQLAVVPCVCAAGQEVARRWRSLPREAEGITFATLRNVPHPKWQAARAKVAAFVAQPRGWLTLAGAYGTGKTRLVYAALNELAGRGVYGRYLTMPDLLDQLRDGIKAGIYADRLDRIVTAPILALDELDKFREDSDWSVDVLEKLFIRRYQQARFTGTILIYNRERAERLPAFLRSRVRDGHFAFVDLDGPDLRPIAAEIDPWDRGEGEKQQARRP